MLIYYHSLNTKLVKNIELLLCIKINECIILHSVYNKIIFNNILTIILEIPTCLIE